MTQEPFIIAVDDDEDIRYTLQAIADYAGWRFATFADGPDLLAYLDMPENTPASENTADLFLVDFHLPGIDGITLIASLRRRFPSVPILVLTVDESQRVADRCLAAGASDFALKPIKAPDLIARVRAHLAKANVTKPTESPPAWLGRRSLEPHNLPKGLQESTLRLLISALEKHGRVPRSVEELSSDAGLAAPTVYRYLQYLVEFGVVTPVEEYGRVGRPRRRYVLSD